MSPKPEDPLDADFRLFLCVTWRHLGLPDPTPLQYDIAEFLQHGPRRKMVMAFRGVGKSAIYAAFVCWRLRTRPDAKIILVSATKPLADAMAGFVRRLVREMPALDGLRPAPGQRDAESAFDVGPARAAKDPSVRSVGIGGQITGSRADEILADDVEILNNAASDQARQKLAEQIREFDAVLKPGGAVTYLGTPQSMDSVYWRLLERGYALRVWPAQIPDEPARYQGRLAPFVRRRMRDGARAGAPLEPGRFPLSDLAERRKSYGRSGYALQFMLDPSRHDDLRHPLKLADLVLTPLDPEKGPMAVRWSAEARPPAEDGPAPPCLGLPGDRFGAAAEISADRAPYQGAVLAIDPSGRGRDETGYAVVKILNAQLFLTAAGGLRGGYDDATLARLAALAAEGGVDAVVIEANFGDGMFAKLFAPFLARAGARAEISEIRASGAKTRRIIDTLEPVLMQHRLIVDPAVARADAESAGEEVGRALFFQMTRISAEPGGLSHDDRLDALAIAVGWFTERLALSVEDAAESARARALKRAARDLLGELKGRPARRRGALAPRGPREGAGPYDGGPLSPGARPRRRGS